MTRKMRGFIAAFAMMLAGTVMIACGKPTAPGETLVTLEVGASTARCTGEVQNGVCLLVRAPGTTEWTYFYGGIEGFVWQSGFEYTLLLARRTIPNPPMDASSEALRLVRVLEKRSVISLHGG